MPNWMQLLIVAMGLAKEILQYMRSKKVPNKEQVSTIQGLTKKVADARKTGEDLTFL